MSASSAMFDRFFTSTRTSQSYVVDLLSETPLRVDTFEHSFNMGLHRSADRSCRRR